MVVEGVEGRGLGVVETRSLLLQMTGGRETSREESG